MVKKKKITREEAEKKVEEVFECCFSPLEIPEDEKEDFRKRYDAYCRILVAERYEIVDEDSV